MTAIFEELAADVRHREAAEYLAPREVPVPARLTGTYNELDPQVTVLRQPGTVCFAGLVREWPDGSFAASLLDSMHQRDVQRAARPPVLQVTVTPPAGTPAPPPGQYEVQTGPNPQVVSFRPAPVLALTDTRTDLCVVTDAPVRPRRRIRRFLRVFAHQLAA